MLFLANALSPGTFSHALPSEKSSLLKSSFAGLPVRITRVVARAGRLRFYGAYPKRLCPVCELTAACDGRRARCAPERVDVERRALRRDRLMRWRSTSSEKNSVPDPCVIGAGLL